MKTIVKTLHGSKLYGVNHAGSDNDLKCVFSHSLTELITGHDDCFRQTHPDDTEFLSLRRFAALLEEQQTNVIEMLFTPNKFIIETSPAWEELRENSDKLVSKNILPFIGYAKTQARVYSEKGKSLNMLNGLNDDLKRWIAYHIVDENTKAVEYTDGNYRSVKLDALCDEYPDIISRGQKLNSAGNTVHYVQVLDKQFECLVSVKEWAWRIQTMINKYGERAKEAAANGAFDRKAVYHSLRIIDEAVELLETGGLVFPRPADTIVLLKAIRFDDKVSFDEAAGMIVDRYDYLMETALPKSSLKDDIDRDYLTNWYLSAQTAHIKKELTLNK